MAISRMKKVEIIGCSADKEAILSVLQNEEFMQINIVEDAPEFFKKVDTDKETIENQLKVVEHIITFLSTYVKEKKGMFERMALMPISGKDYANITKNFDVDKACKDIQDTIKKHNDIKTEIQNLKLRVNHLRQWIKLDVPVDKLGRIGHTERMLVQINPQMYKQYENDLKGVQNAECIIINQNNDDFGSSGLLQSSLIRLGFLAVLPAKNVVGNIGRI